MLISGLVFRIISKSFFKLVVMKVRLFLRDLICFCKFTYQTYQNVTEITRMWLTLKKKESKSQILHNILEPVQMSLIKLVTAGATP